MQALLILLFCLVTLAILARRYGVDSRDGLDWSPPDRARSRGRLLYFFFFFFFFSSPSDLKRDRPDGSHQPCRP